MPVADLVLVALLPRLVALLCPLEVLCVAVRGGFMQIPPRGADALWLWVCAARTVCSRYALPP